MENLFCLRFITAIFSFLAVGFVMVLQSPASSSDDSQTVLVSTTPDSVTEATIDPKPRLRRDMGNRTSAKNNTANTSVPSSSPNKTSEPKDTRVHPGYEPPYHSQVLLRQKNQSHTTGVAILLTGQDPRAPKLSPIVPAFMAATPAVSIPSFVPAAQSNPDLASLKALFSEPMDEVALVRAKFTIDKMIDPSIDIEAGVAWFEHAARVIESMAGPDADDMKKMAAVRTFIYKSGPWNEYRPFAYDPDDPLGEKISNKLMMNYIASRRGNCITMPFLVILLADRLGLDVTASTAPLHVFVKFTPASGETINLEATSGALPARDVWYREQMPMTDLAVKNGVYMKRLNRREMMAVMGTVLVEYFIDVGQHARAAETADILIPFYDTYAYLHVARGTAIYHLLDMGLYQRYPTWEDVPMKKRAYFDFLHQQNNNAFNTAEFLGWQPGAEGLGFAALPAEQIEISN